MLRMILEQSFGNFDPILQFFKEVLNFPPKTKDNFGFFMASLWSIITHFSLKNKPQKTTFRNRFCDLP